MWASGRILVEAKCSELSFSKIKIKINVLTWKGHLQRYVFFFKGHKGKLVAWG